MKNESGAIAILTVIMIAMLLGFAALSIDTGHLMVSKNELQNAADAGALAGARDLYNADATIIQPSSNQTAYEAATVNLSEKSAVEVIWTSGTNTGDVERGHWAWGTGTLARGFYPSSSTAVIDLWSYTDIELDQNPNFINAMRVTTRRQDTRILTYLAGIVGINSLTMEATAVAYLGFAGTFAPGEFDVPIALCEEFLMNIHTGEYECGEAVLYEHAENAMWTNMMQPAKNTDGSYPACTSGNADNIGDAIDGGNIDTVHSGIDVGVNNGIISTNVVALIDKWEGLTTPVDGDDTVRQVWKATFPVINCFDVVTGTEENTCARLIGGVEVEILWMTKKENAEGYAKAPYEYYSADSYGTGDSPIFSSETEDDQERWNEFATDPDIMLVEDDGATPLQLEKNQIYFRASCEAAEPAGGTGGPNFGVLSKRPVLVH